MELKSFGNMYYEDYNGQTLIYPETQVRWEWKSNQSNRWYAFEYKDSVRIEIEYKKGKDSNNVDIGDEKDYELVIMKSVTPEIFDEKTGKIYFKEDMIIRTPKIPNKESDEYTVRRSLIQWFRRGGATYEIYHDKFNKEIETELYEEKKPKKIVYNYGGRNIVEIDKIDNTIVDNGVLGRNSESGKKILIRTRVMWLLDNNELPDFVINVLEDEYRKVDIGMTSTSLNDIYQNLYDKIKDSLQAVPGNLESNLVIRKDISGWMLYYKDNNELEEDSNPTFHRGYRSTYEVRPPYKMRFPPTPEDEEEEDDEDGEKQPSTEVVLRIQKDELLGDAQREGWDVFTYNFEENKENKLVIVDSTGEIETLLEDRADLAPVTINEPRRVKKQVYVNNSTRPVLQEKDENLSITLNWQDSNPKNYDTILYRVT